MVLDKTSNFTELVSSLLIPNGNYIVSEYLRVGRTTQAKDFVNWKSTLEMQDESFSCRIQATIFY